MRRIIFTAILAILILACGRHPLPVTTPLPPSTIAITEHALLSVVHLTGMRVEGDSVQPYGCTAFAIDVRKFLTAEHCIGEKMMLDGRYQAFQIAGDPMLDLAIIVSDYIKPALPIRTEPLVRGEPVTGLGYGYSWAHPLITHHFVMILNYSPWGDVAPGTWYNGSFVGGQSGGPCIDLKGHVVGVMQRGDYQSGYGVDSATIIRFLQSTMLTLD